MAEIRPTPPDRAEAAWCRAQQYAVKLSEALDEVDDLGGPDPTVVSPGAISGLEAAEPAQGRVSHKLRVSRRGRIP